MVLQIFRRRAGGRAEVKASAAAPVVAFQGAGRAAWSARDTATLTRVGFLGNPVAFRCVKIIAEAAAAVPVVVQDATGGSTCIRCSTCSPRPIRGRAGAALLESFYGHLLLSGDGYLEAAGVGPRRRAARALRAALGPDEGGAGGRRLAGGLRVYASGRRSMSSTCGRTGCRCCTSRASIRRTITTGCRRWTRRRAAIDVHNSASTWSKALLDNAARPSGAIVYKGADGQGQLASDQYARLVDELETHHQGARNAGRPMLLEGGLDWKPMGFSPSDMEFHRTKEAAARDVALAFGVPPMLLGLPGDNTYANYSEAHRAFYRLTVLPLVAKTLAAMSGWLPALYGAAFQVKVDDDNVPALAEEREALWRRISGAGFLSDGEKRRCSGCRSCRRGEVRAAAARGGGSRFLYEPFDAAAARIEVNERIQEERWAQLERRLDADRGRARPAGEADLGGGLRRRVADPRRHRLRAPHHYRVLREVTMMHRSGGPGPLETKFCGFDGELALKDGAEIAGYASLFGAADQGGDVVQKGAYGASLARLAKAGSGVKMLWQHDPTRPIGVWDEVREDGRGLFVKGRLLLEVQAAREAHVLLQARRDRRAVDRLPHAQEREGRGRPAAAARDRALGGVAGHLPDAPRGAGAGRSFRCGGRSESDLARTLAESFREAREMLA